MQVNIQFGYGHKVNGGVGNDAIKPESYEERETIPTREEAAAELRAALADNPLPEGTELLYYRAVYVTTDETGWFTVIDADYTFETL